MKVRAWCCLFAVAALAPVVRAQQSASVALSTNNCVVRFEVASTWQTIRGEARQISGWVKSGRPGDLSTLQGAVEMDVAGLVTGDNRRDRKIRGFSLEADRFPRISFALERCNVFEGGMLTATGQLTIRDVTRRLVLGARYFAGEGHYRLVGGGGLKWADYGIRDPSVFLSRLQPDVKLFIEVTLPRN